MQKRIDSMIGGILAGLLLSGITIVVAAVLLAQRGDSITLLEYMKESVKLTLFVTAGTGVIGLVG